MTTTAPQTTGGKRPRSRSPPLPQAGGDSTGSALFSVLSVLVAISSVGIASYGVGVGMAKNLFVSSQETAQSIADPWAKGSEVKLESDALTNSAVNVEIDENKDYGNHNENWEDGHSSWDEFGHDNEHCRLERISVQEWEEGKYWEKSTPVIVVNVTDGWAANENWKLSEMLRLYPDAEATMGDGRRVGEIGPDAAGNLLTPTTVKEFITQYMYHPFKYFFDRKVAIPKGMLNDCRPFPMPTRQFLEDPDAVSIEAPSHKKKVDPRDEYTVWRDHLAIAIGADQQGLSFHHHGSAWNTVIFGKKRWIMYDPKRWQDKSDETRQRRVALASDADWETILPTPEWIRQLYPDPFRQHEIHTYGHDCVQHAGEMMYVPKQWMHMVVNIGDTVSIVSEQGLEKGTGKVADDFLYDPFAESSDDSEEESSSDDYEGRGPPPGWYDESSSDDGEEDEEWSSDE